MQCSVPYFKQQIACILSRTGPDKGIDKEAKSGLLLDCLNFVSDYFLVRLIINHHSGGSSSGGPGGGGSGCGGSGSSGSGDR